MATFTMELRYVNSLVDVGRVYLSHYPIFDEGYRTPLNQKILDHYWTREIGQETIELFGFYLKRKMNEIMPTYNELYRSLRMEYDPLSTVDMRTINRGEGESTSRARNESTGHTSGDSKSRVIGSDYPQAMLSGSEDYATSGQDVNTLSSGREQSSATADSLDHSKSIGDSHTIGRSGSAMSLVQEFRAQIINVDMMVITELEPMFMQIFNTGDFEPGEPFGYGYTSRINPAVPNRYLY